MLSNDVKLKKLLSLMDEESLTKEDFLKAFRVVTDFAKELQVKTAREVKAIADKLGTRFDSALASLKADFSSLRADITRSTRAAVSEMETAFSKKMAAVDSRLDSILDGKDADEDAIALRVEEKLFEPIVDRVEKDLPRLGAATRDGLELLKDDDRLDVSAIKGLDELLKKNVQTTGFTGGGIVGRDLFKDVDISAQLDGVTKTFNIPAVWNIISVHLSSFPHALRKNVDFTYTPQSITFTNEIDAASTLAAGQTCVLTVVTG